MYEVALRLLLRLSQIREANRSINNSLLAELILLALKPPLHESNMALVQRLPRGLIRQALLSPTHKPLRSSAMSISSLKTTVTPADAWHLVKVT